MQAHGDPSLPDELLEQAGWLRALARALCRDEHAAADLVQETWLAALKGGVHARDARAWLGSVARRLAASRGRSEGRRDTRERRVASERPPESPDTADTLARVELSARLARAVAQLDEPYRTTLALRYYEGLPPRRIAQRLGTDVRAVESRLRRGRERLREALDRDCGGREVWFGTALALAVASGEHGGRGVALVAALALLVGGGGTGLAIHRARSSAEPVPRAAVELRQPVDVVASIALGQSPPDSPVEPEVRETRSAVADTHGGLHLIDGGSGSPLVGVQTTWHVGGDLRAALSDATGRIEFGDVGTSSELHVVVAGTARTRVHRASLPAHAYSRLEVPRRGGRVAGSVVDLDGRPVPSAEVLAWARHEYTPDLGSPERSVLADLEGRFVLEDMASAKGGRQSWSLAARAEGAASFGRLEGSIHDPDVNDEITLVVEPAWRVRGRVLDVAGRPVAGAQLIAYGADRSKPKQKRGATWTVNPGRPGFHVRSAADGSFEFQVVEPTADFDRPWRLQVNSPEHRTLLAQIEAPGWMDIVLEWGGRLDGVVVDASGSPVSGARVELRSREPRSAATTDAAGSFAFEGLSDLEGALLAVTADGHALAVRYVDIEALGSRVRIELEIACRLDGVALDASGAPLPRQLVQIEGDRVLGSAWMPRSRGFTWEEYFLGSDRWCDESGRFSLDGLYPGRFRLYLRDRPGGELLAFKQVELRSDAETPAFFLRVGEGLEHTLTIRGRVVDAHGVPVDSFALDGRNYLDGETQPVQDLVQRRFEGTGGEFEVRGLPSGRWRFGAFSWDSGVHRGTPASEPQHYGPGVVDLGELRFLDPQQR